MLWHKTDNEWNFVKRLALRDVLSSMFSTISSHLGCDMSQFEL